MPKQIHVVTSTEIANNSLTPDMAQWRNGDDMEAWLIDAIDGAMRRCWWPCKS